MKTKQITALLLLVCIILTPVLTSSASAHTYDYVYTNASVLTPDSFEDVFGGAELDRAAYTYELEAITTTKFDVTIYMEIKIGNSYFSGVASGQIKSHSLPSGESLLEGPVNGEITVNSEVYPIVVGFTKLLSTNQSMLTITTSSNANELVAFSFGEDIIRGEVLEFLQNKTTRQIGQNSVESNLELDEYGYISGEEASPMLIPPGYGPGFSQITHPGEGSGYGNLGADDRYEYQISNVSYFENTQHPSQEIRIYHDEARNTVLATLIPKTSSARSYLSGLGYNYSAAVLDSFSVRIDLKHDAPPSQYAYVMGTYIPGIDDAPSFEKDDEYFSSILSDLLSMVDFVPTSTVMSLIDDMQGSISGKRSSFYAQVDVDMSVNPEDMDEIACGFPVHFNLIKATDNYVSNTEYTITSNVNYLLIGVSTNGEAEFPIYLNFYVSDICVYEGVIDLQ